MSSVDQGADATIGEGIRLLFVDDDDDYREAVAGEQIGRAHV